MTKCRYTLISNNGVTCMEGGKMVKMSWNITTCLIPSLSCEFKSTVARYWLQGTLAFLLHKNMVQYPSMILAANRTLLKLIKQANSLFGSGDEKTQNQTRHTPIVIWSHEAVWPFLSTQSNSFSTEVTDTSLFVKNVNFLDTLLLKNFF